MHQCYYNLKFTVQSCNYNFPYQQSYLSCNLATEEHTEQFTVNTPNTVKDPHKQLGCKAVFKKQGELKPSRKTNTHLDNHFYDFKNPPLLVIQKHNFPKQ